MYVLSSAHMLEQCVKGHRLVKVKHPQTLTYTQMMQNEFETFIKRLLKHETDGPPI